MRPDDHNPDNPGPRGPDTTGLGDGGPAVRPMNAQVRSRARRALLAEVSATAPHRGLDGSRADAVAFDREGLDDAPPLVNKRWFFLGAGLVTAAAAVAIVAGTGLISGEDLGLTPAETTTPEESIVDGNTPDDDLDRDRVVSACQERLREAQVADGSNTLGIPRSPETENLLFFETSDEFAVVGLSAPGKRAVCAFTADGDRRTEITGPEISGLVQQDILGWGGSEANPLLVIAGQVDPRVTGLEVGSDAGDAVSATISTGFFSAVVPVEPDQRLDFVVTLRDGSTQTQAVDLGGPQEGFAAAACLEEVGIEFPEPGSEGEASDGDGSSAYRFVAEHGQADYVFGAVSDGEEFTLCATTLMGDLWTATLANEMPFGAPIMQADPTPAATDAGPYPVMGRAAPEVTAVKILRADGSSREAYLQDGFYSVMMSAEKATDLRYTVTMEDGGTTTLGSK